jgi:hypothetical protein
MGGIPSRGKDGATAHLGCESGEKGKKLFEPTRKSVSLAQDSRERRQLQMCMKVDPSGGQCDFRNGENFFSRQG